MTTTQSPVVSSEVKKQTTVGGITINMEKGLYKADYQKEHSLTVELRQVIKTQSDYPAQRFTGDLQDSLFSIDEFETVTKSYDNTETRIAWMNVPEGTTIEVIVQRIATAMNNGARLQRVLSNHPILDNNQKYAVESSTVNRTLEDFANSQVVRYPVNHVTNPGQLILHNGKPQYRRVFFAATNKPDIDNRNDNPTDFYFSAEILAEMNGSAATMQGQSL